MSSTRYLHVLHTNACGAWQQRLFLRAAGAGGEPEPGTSVAVAAALLLVLLLEDAVEPQAMLVERFDGDTVQAARDHLVTRGHLSASGSLTESFRKAIQPVSPGCPSLLELHSFLAFLEAPRMRYSHGSPSLRSCRAGYTSRRARQRQGILCTSWATGSRSTLPKRMLSSTIWRPWRCALVGFVKTIKCCRHAA